MNRQFLIRAIYEAGWFTSVGCAFGIAVALQGFFGARPEFEASFAGLLGRILAVWLVIFSLCTGVLRGKLQRAFLRDVIYGMPWLVLGLGLVYAAYTRPEFGEPFVFISWFVFLALGTASFAFRDRSLTSTPPAPTETPR